MLSEKEAEETEPYKHKYESRKQLQSLLASVPLGEGPAAVFASCLLRFHIGTNQIDCEETGEGEKTLKESLAALEALQADGRSLTLRVATLNHYGILWANRKDPTTARQYLDQACAEYEQRHGPAPLSIKKLSGEGSEEGRVGELEAAHTHTLFYLAQCYGSLGDADKSARYCHMTLQRQLETGDYQPLEWSIHSAAMSQVYLGRNEFVTAAHYLRCAVMIGERAEEGEAKATKMADIGLCWCKYYLNLLAAGSLEKDSHGAAAAVASGPRFATLEKQAEQERVCTTPPHSYEEALGVCNAGVKWVQRVQAVYKLDGYVNDYIQAAQDHSQMLRHLARLDCEASNACKIHKKRVDMLQPLRKGLNAQYYLAVCRQLDYEIAETFVEMSSLKRLLLSGVKDPDRLSALQKICQLIDSAVAAYTSFLDSMRGPDRKMPDVFEEHLVRPVLLARFWIARLRTLKQGIPRPAHIAALEAGLQEYADLVAYCERHPEVQCFKEELEMCREMVALMPAQIHRVKEGTM